MVDPLSLTWVTLAFERDGSRFATDFPDYALLRALVGNVEFFHRLPMRRQRWFIQDIGIIRPRPDLLRMPLAELFGHMIYLYGGPGNERLDWPGIENFRAPTDNELGFSWDCFRDMHQNSNRTFESGRIVHPTFDIHPRPFEDAHEITNPLEVAHERAIALETKLDVRDYVDMWKLVKFRKMVGDFMAMHQLPAYCCKHSFTGNYNMEDEPCLCQADYLLQLFVYVVRLFQYVGRTARHNPPVSPGSSDESNKRYFERIIASCRMTLTLLYVEWLDGICAFANSPFCKVLADLLSLETIDDNDFEPVPGGQGRILLTYECLERCSEKRLDYAYTILDALNMVKDYRVFYGPQHELPTDRYGRDPPYPDIMNPAISVALDKEIFRRDLNQIELDGNTTSSPTSETDDSGSSDTDGEEQSSLEYSSESDHSSGTGSDDSGHSETDVDYEPSDIDDEDLRD